MATKPEKVAETTEPTEEATDSPILDSLTASVRKLILRGKERGYVTYDELNAALPPEEFSSEQIEDTMTTLSELGINLVESEETEEGPPPEKEEPETGVQQEEDELGRTDDPVRMYLREMGSVELLSREGEIAIAKRIEAGRHAMIRAFCESPLTMSAVAGWRDRLEAGQMLLREVIDLDATYGGAPVGPDGAPQMPMIPPAEGVAVVAAAPAPPPPAPADGADAIDPPVDGESSDEEFDEGNISLAAMEAAVRPRVLETFNQIASLYKRYQRVLDQRLQASLAGEPAQPAQVKRHEKMKRELVDLMEGVRFNNGKIEAIVDELYGYNKQIISLEGELLRLALA